MLIENFKIERKDNLFIKGHIMKADNSYKSIIIYSNCFTCTMAYTSNRKLSELLVDAGFLLVRYDYLGSGKSDGTFETVLFEDQVEDLKAVVNYVENHFKGEMILLGHSLGSITSLIVAHERKLDKLITIAAPHTFKGLKNRVSKYNALYESATHYTIKVGTLDYCIRKDYVSEKYDRQYDDLLKTYGGKSLSFHSRADLIAPFDGAMKFNAIRKELGVLVEYEGNHMITGSGTRKFICDHINKWYKETSRI